MPVNCRGKCWLAYKHGLTVLPPLPLRVSGQRHAAILFQESIHVEKLEKTMLFNYPGVSLDSRMYSSFPRDLVGSRQRPWPTGENDTVITWLSGRTQIPLLLAKLTL